MYWNYVGAMRAKNIKLNITDVVAGNYSMMFSKTGYYSRIIPGITLTNGSIITVDAQLAQVTFGINQPAVRDDRPHRRTRKSPVLVGISIVVLSTHVIEQGTGSH